MPIGVLFVLGLPLPMLAAFGSITMKLMRAVLLKVLNDFVMFPKGPLEGTQSFVGYGTPKPRFKDSEIFQSNQPALCQV